MLLYLYYVVLTLRSSAGLVEEGHGTTADYPMFLCRARPAGRLPVVICQLLLGLGLLVGGAKAFIYSVGQLSMLLAISALILSLLIIPVATELPEKVNSILWIRRRKDTLAVGNLTGAMVFQGTLLPALGLLTTPWQPEAPVVVAIILTLLATLWLRWHLTTAAFRFVTCRSTGCAISPTWVASCGSSGRESHDDRPASPAPAGASAWNWPGSTPPMARA